MSEPLTLFDYAQLDENAKNLVQTKTDEIKALVKRSARDIIEIGQRLIEVKAQLPHGQFGPWLEAEFGWSYPLSAKFMNVANQFKSIKFIDLEIAPSALYLLAAPSTPGEARDEALSLAQDGETITHQRAKEIISDHQKPPDLNADSFWTGDNTEVTGTEPSTQGGELPQSTARYTPMLDHSRPRTLYTPKGLDACQTPPYALDPLLPYLSSGWVIWEPACGEGLLVGGLYDTGYSQGQVISGDMTTGQDFYEYEPGNWDCLITNPPYSNQFDWLRRCYNLKKPFALLLKVDVLGTKTAQELFSRYGVEVIFMDKRINFKMPYKGYDGGGSWFAVAWYTWGLNIGRQMTFASIDHEKEDSR